MLERMESWEGERIAVVVPVHDHEIGTRLAPGDVLLSLWSGGETLSMVVRGRTVEEVQDLIDGALDADGGIRNDDLWPEHLDVPRP